MSVADQIVYNKATKATKKVTEPKLAPLVTFMNGAVARGVSNSRAPANTLMNNTKKITFKDYNSMKDKSKVSKNGYVIDLNTFTGLKEFKRIYLEAAKYNAAIKGNEEMEAITTDGLVRGIYDPILRGYLSMAEVRFVERKTRAKKTDEEEPEEVSESVHLTNAIESLHIPKARETSITDLVEAVDRVLDNENDFKIKAFNKVFPLGVHDPTKEPKLMNRMYLTKWLEHSDELLKYLVANIDSVEAETLRINAIAEVHKLLAADYKAKHSSINDPVELMKVAQYNTFMHRFTADRTVIDMITAFVPPRAGAKGGPNESTIKAEIKEWPVYTVTRTGYNIAPTAGTIGSNELHEDIFELIKVLRKYLTFINTMIAGKEYFESKNITASYEEAYEKFLEHFEQYTLFREEHDGSSIEELDDFLVYMVQAIAFIRKYRGAEPVSPSEFNSGNVMFKFALKLSKELKSVYTREVEEVEDEVRKIIEKFDELTISMIADVSTVKDSDKDNATVFDRIGSVINNIEDYNVDKNLRIAVGLYIVKSLIIEVERILAKESSKKSALTVYIAI
jgi:hypothetical protein